MDSLLSRLDTPGARLALAAIAASTLTALTIFSFQSLRREETLRSLKNEASALPSTKTHRLNSIGGEELRQLAAYREQKSEYDEELVLEQLARNRAFFGEEGLEKIRAGFVIVVGAGGVGSWTATMLARSGIGKYPSLCCSSLHLSLC
jgi:tRNA threonylcarbamoyladenosine dehydratase